MSNGWTGGQYSLLRVSLGLFLALHFAELLPWGREVFSSAGVLPEAGQSPLIHAFPNVLAVWDTPLAVTLLLLTGVAAAFFFAFGKFDRVAALVGWYALACLFGRNPLISNPSLPFLGWMLLAHAAIPVAPYGSLAARGRTDPRGDWSMPPAIFGAAWVVMSVAYTYSGLTKLVSPSWLDGSAFHFLLQNPLARPSWLREVLLSAPPALLEFATWGALALELFFAPLALFRRLRPLAWLAMLAMHFGLIVLIDFAELSLGMVALHLFTFDPAWVRRKLAAAPPDVIFYDGHCGLCHGFVRFVLSEDTGGSAFRFAAQQDTLFARIPAAQRAGLPDSIVVQRGNGSLLVRSAAIRLVLQRLGGFWRLLAALLSVVPSFALDFSYDTIATWRHRLFRRVPEACPLLPPDLRARFLRDEVAAGSTA